MDEDPKEREARAVKEALKIMGFKIFPTPEALHKRYILLARKYHPSLILPPHLRGMDAGGSWGTTGNATPEEQKLIREVNLRMANLTAAEATLTKHMGGMWGEKEYTVKELRPYIAQIDKRLKTRSMNEIEDITADFIDKNKGNDEEVKKYQAASEAIIHQEELVDSLRQRQYNAIQHRIRGTLRSPEERERDLAREQIDQAILNKSIEMTKSRFNHIVHNIKFFNGKPHVKIGVVKTKKRKPYLKYILLTTSLIIGILGGKYLFDAIRKAYIKKPVLFLPKVKT